MRQVRFYNNNLRFGQWGNFQLHKIWNQVEIIFRRNKELEKLSIEYYRNWRFDKAYLFVNFKFKNAVWFRIEGIKGHNFSRPILLNLEKIKSDYIELEVFGFFQKQVYEIDLRKVARINTQSFKTKIENINTLKLVQQKARMRGPKIRTHIDKPVLKFRKTLVNNYDIKTSHNPFKIQNYI